MGNYRFRLSNMMPKAWFYKMKDMGGTRKHGGNRTLQHPTSPASTTKTKTQTSKTKQSNHSYPRKSYYFSRELVPSDRFYGSADFRLLERPRKSSKKQSRKRNMIRSSPRIVTSSVSAGCSCRATLCAKADSPPEYSVSSSRPFSSSSSDSSSDQKLCEPFPLEFRSDCILTTESCLHSCSCNFHSNAVDNKPFVKKFDKLDDFDKFSGLELPPIITKPAKFNDKLEVTYAHGLLSVKEERITIKKGQKKASPVRKLSVNSPGVRLRINSPKIASRKIQGHYSRKSISSSSSSSSRKSLSDSFAVVKSSFDPQRDFRDSMVEMIMENNIRASKDLEDLLACYLSLNSDEYHDLIIHVFKQIWFELGDVRLK